LTGIMLKPNSLRRPAIRWLSRVGSSEQITTATVKGRLKIALMTVSGGLVHTTVYSLVVFLRGSQRLIEIPQEVIKALQADGNTDHIRADASRDLLLIG
jgi:hypothetical protein